MTAAPTCRLRKCPFSTQTCSGERPHRSRVLTCAPCVSRSWTIRCWLVAAAICRAVCVGRGSRDKTLCESSGVFFVSPPHRPLTEFDRGRPHLPVVLLQVQAAAGGHFGGEHVGQSSASLRHGDVEESGRHGVKNNTSQHLHTRVTIREEFVCSHKKGPSPLL